MSTEALSAHLKTLSDAVLSAMYLQAMEQVLEAGEPLRYDPDQDIDTIDDPDGEFPSVNEMIAERTMDLVKQELERRAILKASS